MKQREKSRGVLILLLALFALSLAPLQVMAEDGAIPQRSDIEEKYKWKVDDLYPNVEAWEKDFAFIKENVGSFEKFRGHLGDSPEMLLECLKLSDSLDIYISNLYVYAYLKLDEDNRQSDMQELTGRIGSLNSEIVGAISFMQPELIGLGKDRLLSFLSENKELELYRFYIEDMLRQQEHVLSPEQEKILALSGQMGGTASKIFNMIDAADHKYGTLVNSEGETVDLTAGRYYRMMESTDRDLRKRASDTVAASWEVYENTLAATLGGSLQKDLFYSKARGYEDCLSSSLDGNAIPTSVVYNLIDAVNANLAPLHKLTALRKKMQGVDTFYTYDMGLSLVPEFEKEYSYEQAMDFLSEGLKPLGDKYVNDLKTGLSSGWVDVFETEGKGTGAYSWGTYTSHPYVLMNYNNTLDAVFTLAHEMGHAMNSYYSHKAEPYIYHGHSLFTAEVASTCNEAILLKYMLEKSESREEKLVLLNHYIRQISGTFFTQVMFTEFELAAHKQVESGGATSAAFFRSTYRDIYQKYYGPDLVIEENKDMGCLKISHFYRQYYVYQYATCYAAGQALSQKIIEGDQKALDAYLEFLATGSSKHPIDILKDAGVDMTTSDPVESTLKIFAELVDQMEELLLEEN